MLITKVNVNFNKYIDINIKNSKTKNESLKLFKCNINCYNNLRCINCVNIIISNYNNNNYILVDKKRNESYSVLKNTINFELECENKYNYSNNYNSVHYYNNNDNYYYNNYQINDQIMINNNFYYNKFYNNNDYNNNYNYYHELDQNNLICNINSEKNNFICNNTNVVEDTKSYENLSNEDNSEYTKSNNNLSNEDNLEDNKSNDDLLNEDNLEESKSNSEYNKGNDDLTNEDNLEESNDDLSNEDDLEESNDDLSNEDNLLNEDNLEEGNDDLSNEDNLEESNVDLSNEDNLKESKSYENEDLKKSKSNEEKSESIDLHISKELRERKKLLLLQLKKKIKNNNKKIKNKLRNKNKKNKKINEEILKNNDMILINNSINENKDELLIKVEELYPYDFYYLKNFKYSDLKNYIVKNPIKKNILNDIIDKYKDCLISIYLSFIIEKKHMNEAKKSLENCTIIDVFNLFKNIGLNRLMIEQIISERFFLESHLNINNQNYINIDKEILNNLFVNFKKSNLTLFLFNDVIESLDKLFLFEDFIFDAENFNGDFYFLEILESDVINNFLKESLLNTIKNKIKELINSKFNIKKYLQILKNKKDKSYSEILFLNFNYIKDNKFKFCKTGYYKDGNIENKIYYSNTSKFVIHLLSSSSKLIV